MIRKTSLYLCMYICLVVDGSYINGPKHGKIAVCFVSSWALYRKPPLNFGISDIDPTLCTHLVYAFAILDEESSTIKSLNQWLDIEKDEGNAGYRNLTRIKNVYPHIKVILSVGGWNEGSVKFSKMAADRSKRIRFIKSTVDFLKKYDFDGLDLMWKYPTARGGVPEDKENFVTLIKDLKVAFLLHGYILTSSLGHSRELMGSAYDLISLDRYLDLIYMFGYDYHGPWDSIVGPSAPLKGLHEWDEKSVEYTIKYLLSFGVSPNKLILGIQFLGRTFTLKDPNVKEIELGKTEAQNVGFSGPYINGTNMYGYNEICLDLKNDSKWTYYWDKNSSTPYLRDGSRIISYDDTRSIANKVKLAIDYNLAGFMIWSIDLDDFKGICDTPRDTYIDFVERYNNLTKDEVWQDTMNFDLFLADSNFESKIYGNLRDKLNLKLLKKNFKNYPLLRTIHEAIDMALEEKKITDAIKLAKTSLIKQNREQKEQIGEDTPTPCIRTCSEMCFYGTGL